MKTRKWNNRNHKLAPIWQALTALPMIMTITILLSACGGQDARSTPEFFIPPTLAQKPATPTPQATSTSPPEPTEAALCEDDLSFLDDVTIPDDTTVAPGQEIIKTWLVQNSGSCNWESDYTLRNVDGLPMGAVTIQALFPLRSGGETEITITFIAPTDSGRHITKWQAHDPEGIGFGQQFYMQIIVDPNLDTSGE